MFPGRYFAKRYFAGRYFAPVAGGIGPPIFTRRIFVIL